jgi:TonB family protein
VTNTEIQDVRVRPLGRGTFVGGFLMTLAIHAGLGALVWYGSIKAEQPEPHEREIMITQMIKFGTKREKFWLPRITEPPKPKVVEPTIKVAEDPNAKPAVKEEPKEKEKPEKADLSKKVQEMLKRRKAMFQNAEESTEGDPNGDRNSDSNTASEGDPYATAIYNAIRDHWTVPTGLSLGDVLNFETAISVRIAEDGTLLEPKLRRSSGNALFDDSCLQAVQATRHVPPPPPSQRAKYRRGLTLAFDGKSLAR